MRILHLASSHRWTGVAEPAADLAQAQQALGHKVHFACIEGHSFWRRLRTRGVPFIPGFKFQSGLDLAGMWSDVRLLRRLVVENRYEIIHAHLMHDHWIAAVALGGWRGRRETPRDAPALIRTVHRDLRPRRDRLHRRLFASATDAVIAPSTEGRRAIVEGMGLDPDRVAWIRGAVDLERFNPRIDAEQNRRLWSIPAEAPVAGIIARMRPGRGHLEFIATIDEVLRRVPGATYLIAGRGELKYPIKRLVQAHPHGSHLIRAGYRKRDLPETYAACDVTVLLARGSDGSCRAMLEAMACGRPVIGARVGAIADALDPGRTGWLIDPKNLKQELTEALIEALADRKRLAAMGKEARKDVEAHYTQMARARATLTAYEAALEARRGVKV